MQETNIHTQHRIKSLDVLRGFALILIILFHSSIYNFANIHKIDFSNPPIIVVIMSFMALWGGIFIVYSAVINSLLTVNRIQDKSPSFSIKTASITLGVYLILHYILNIVLGRWNNDFVNNQPDLTIIARVLRTLHFSTPEISKYFDGSSISTIALNLFIVSLILYFMNKNKKALSSAQQYMVFAVAGIVIMVLSFVRVPLYHLLPTTIEHHNFITATILGFTLANPYPLLPYVSYGFFGALIGLMIYNGHKGLLKKVIIPLGVIFLIYGVAGMMNFEKTISTPDYFWYFKTNGELGIFLILVSVTYLVLEPMEWLTNRLSLLTQFSRISLTIYMLETTVSELIRIPLLQLNPDWTQTINGCLLFGFINIVVWSMILTIWKRYNFKYSLEYFWVNGFKFLQKDSTKMDELPV
ncbi:DUF1624 domain-containing protein [candidate division WWE3 bacterium]|nr:DUF1624 domain-containing protein [candidate division WWE3 bacterium]